MNRMDWKKHLPALLIAVFAVVMVWPLVFLGQTHYFRDFGRFYAPIRQAYLNRLLQGEFLIWLPELNCGTPVHGEMVHAFLYPGNVLLFAGESLGWGLYFAFHLFLAGLGARALARRLGATADGALAAAIAYAGSGCLVSQMNQVPVFTVAAWAPVIVATGLSLSDGRRRTVPLLALAFAAAAFGGEPFCLLLTVVFLGILVLAGKAGPRIPALVGIGGAALAALLLATPVLLPAWEVLQEAGRAGGDSAIRDGYGSVHPLRLTTLLSPECMGLYQRRYILEPSFFGVPFRLEVQLVLGLWFGATALIALFLAPVRRSPAVRVLVATVVAFGTLALGDHLGIAPLLMRHVPGISSFQYAESYWLVVTLAAAPLVALAIPGIRRRAGLVLAGLGAVLAAVLAIGFPDHGPAWTGIAAFALAGAAMLAPAAWRPKALTLVLAAELLVLGLRHHVTAEPSRIDPGTGRIGRVLAGMEPQRMTVRLRLPNFRELPDLRVPAMSSLRNFQSVRGIDSGFSYVKGYDPVQPLSRMRAVFGCEWGAADDAQRGIMHRVLGLAGSTHAITDFSLGEDSRLRPILDGPNGIRCYRLLEPGARVRLFGHTQWVRNLDEALELLAQDEFDVAKTLILEGEGKTLMSGRARGARTELLVDRDREVVIRVRTDRPSWLFLADSWAPGWRATVNGEPVAIVPAMGAFRAVPVQIGESTVRFRYAPDWLRIVPVTFGIGVALLLGLVVWARRRRGRREETGL